MEFLHRPIQSWPGPQTKARVRSKYRANYGKTLALLDRELRHLRAQHLVLQVALKEEDIRLDGRPRAGAKASHPGVILSFETPKGPLSFPCDHFDSAQDNLRAIALSLELLRALDRYGVSGRGQQYRGWRALPDVGGTTGRPWWNILEVPHDADRRTIDKAFQQRARIVHPDAGGDPKEWIELQEALRQGRQAAHEPMASA